MPFEPPVISPLLRLVTLDPGCAMTMPPLGRLSALPMLVPRPRI